MHSQQQAQLEIMERMREQQERGCRAAEEARRAAKLPKPMLQKLTEDDMESYLDMFERVAAQQEWPKETWATQLAGLLSGNALECYSSLTLACAKDYDVVKAAILKRYDVNAETYRQRFRTDTRRATESHVNFGERLDDHLRRWEKVADGVELRQLMLLEQFFRRYHVRWPSGSRRKSPSLSRRQPRWLIITSWHGRPRVVECSSWSLQSRWYPHPANPRVIPTASQWLEFRGARPTTRGIFSAGSARDTVTWQLPVQTGRARPERLTASQ